MYCICVKGAMLLTPTMTMRLLQNLRHLLCVVQKGCDHPQHIAKVCSRQQLKVETLAPCEQAWVALGRLYAETVGGAGSGLAASCYMQARSHDPMYAAPWEGMAAMAGTRDSGALSTVSPGNYEAGLRC